MSIAEKLMQMQTRIRVPKSRVNDFGNYKYRSAEDIMKALKPLEKELRVAVKISDDAVAVGANVYIRATVSLIDLEDGDSISTCALAREPATPKAKMDDSQTTGSASSYARKYALSGMFLLDDSIDPDSNNAIDSGEPCSDAQEKTILDLAVKHNVNLEKLYKQQKVKNNRPTAMQAGKILNMFKKQFGVE